MRSVFTLAIFLSATLLFLVQPLTGRIFLPVLGGSPAVWSVCMLFFQAALLLGYLYAHTLSTRVAGRSQWLVHGAVLIAASLTLPLAIGVGEPAGGDPRWWLLRTLSVTVGLPFFALAATSPLMQQWFTRTTDPRARDPYFLYAVANAGSLFGLLGYLGVEPFTTRRALVAAWSVGFWVVAGLVTACAYASASRRQPAPAKERQQPLTGIRLSERLLWIALALVPSVLLLAVTQHLATDVVSAPLLWVAPLVLYLATLIAAFSPRSPGTAQRWGRIAPAAALIVLVLSLGEVRYPVLLIAGIHLAAFTVLAMGCHTRLAGRRPDPSHLTGYFVCVSLGGVLGGVAAAFVAPALSSSVLEYPLAIGAAVLLRPQGVQPDGASRSLAGRSLRWAGAATLLVAGFWCISTYDATMNARPLASSPLFGWLPSLTGDEDIAQRAVRASFVLPAALLLVTPRTALLFAGISTGLLAGAAGVRTGGDVLERQRTFFGVHRVTSVQHGDWHVLTHGTTTHGVQAVRGRLHPLPTAYYHPSGPIGDVVFTLVPDGRFKDVAVIGLGAGALAAYAGKDVRMDFFEIDEAIIRIAEDRRYFTYLADARTRPGVEVRTAAVDGRLGLRAMPAASYDLVVIDAFSSDAIPTHLITREAVALYESRLKARGLIAFHVSSRFFNLPPVLATIAADRGLVGYVRQDLQVPPEKIEEGMRASVWVVLARAENDLGQIARSAPRWLRLDPSPGSPLWTDDYTSVLSVLQ
jgi:hypothetical protein